MSTFYHGIRVIEDGYTEPPSPPDPPPPVVAYGTLRLRMTRAVGGAPLFTAVRYNGVGYGYPSQWYPTLTGPGMTSYQYNNVGNTQRIDDIDINLSTLLSIDALPETIDYYVVRWYPAPEDPRHPASVVVSRAEDEFSAGAVGVTPQEIVDAAPGGPFAGYQFTIDVQRFIRNQVPFFG